MTESFDWKAFQKQVGYSDPEIELLKSDPRRARITQRLESPEWKSKYLVFEVVRSEGCPVGHKPGDRLFFKGCSVLDREKSDPWCVMSMGNFDIMAGICHDRWISGLDPKAMNFNHIPCADCGVTNGGRGRVYMKAYIKDESEL